MHPKYLTRVLYSAALVLIASAINFSVSTRPAHAAGPDIVFVARAHLTTRDDIFDDEVGPAGEFGTGLTKFAPGSKLMIRHGDGTLTTLVNGNRPGAATGNLIDVQAPDVSFDGTKIIFAGATTVDRDAPGYGWRLYEINVDGTGFHKINLPDRTFTSVPNNNPNHYDFGNYDEYGWWNDLSPAYLADGRIVFASTRYPSRSEYDERHTYNLYVANADGTNLHRITTERESLLHPTPLPDGRILFARWWLNFNQPSSTGVFNRIDNRSTDQTLPDGTVIFANPDEQFNPAKGKLPNGFKIRGAPNAWHLWVSDPDGANFQRFAFTPYAEWARTEDSGEDTYTGAQPALIRSGNQTFVAFTSQQDGTMVHSTQKTGIRVARPGAPMLYANTADAIAGLTYDKAWGQNDDSPPYAIHPWGLPDGTILFSYAVTPNAALPRTGTFSDPVTGRTFDLIGSDLNYQLYTMNLNGSNKTLLATSIGNADALDAKPIVARTGWTAKQDAFAATPQNDPRKWNVPNTLIEYAFSTLTPSTIQKATLHNPNVYANAGLDNPFINNSPPPGSIASAQIWLNADQFTGAYCYDDWPQPCATFRQDSQLRAVLYTTVPVSKQGEFTAEVPADTPAFVVLRDKDGRAVSGWKRGYISIAQGSAYAHPGQTVECVGCHLGHVSGSIDSVKNEAVAGWTNVAPYAAASASTHYTDNDPNNHEFEPTRINDRRGWVPIPAGGPPSTDSENPNYQDETTGWISDKGHTAGEWIALAWPTQMKVSKIHLVGPPPTGGDWGGFGQYDSPAPYYVTSGTLRFYVNGAQVSSVNVGQIEPLDNGGTWVTLPTPVNMDRLTFTVNSVQGKWWWEDVAALNEIEVIGQATDQSAPCSSKPAKPALVSPNGTTVTQQPVTLKWNAANCASGYRIVVKQDSTTGTVVLRKGGLSTTQFSLSGLTAGHAYYWKVRACNAYGCLASPWGSFGFGSGVTAPAPKPKHKKP